MELCSVTALAKDIRRRAVQSVFLMLIKPANPVATMEIDTDIEGTNGDDGSVQNGPTHWDEFCNEFADVLKPPGFPPNVTLSMILSCYLVPLHSIIDSITFLLHN